MKPFNPVVATIVVIACWLPFPLHAQEKVEKITYDDHIKPILTRRCSTCHNGQKREGDLDVTNYTNLMQGGGSGTVIEPTDSGSSYLYGLVTHEDSPEMPPGGKIPDPEIQLIAKWIDMGALENKGSKAMKAKPKLDMAISGDATKRPEVIPLPMRMPLEPVIKSSRASVTSLATSPWAPVMAVGTPKQILLYDTSSLQLTGVIPLGESVAHSLTFSRSGQILVAGGGKDGASGKAILFDAVKGERITTIGDELDAVLAADISPSHEYVAIGGPNKLVKLFSIDGELVAEIKKHTDWVTAIEFSPDGKYVATGDRNGGLFVWEADSGNEVYTLKAHSKSITGISWRIDGKIVASCSEDTTVRVWEMSKGRQIKSWGAHGGGATSVEFLRNGQIATCGRDKVAKVWDQNGKMIRQFNRLPDVGVCVSYCDETNRLFASDWSGVIKVWNGADAKHLGDIKANPPSLAERLAGAKAALTTAQSKYNPLAQQVTQTQSQLDQLVKSLDASKATQVQVQEKLTQSEQQLSAAKQRFESTNKQQAQWKTELAEKIKIKPMLQQSFEKANSVSVALPNDQELKQATSVFKNKLDSVTKRISELNSLVAKSDQERTSSKAKMDEMTKLVQVSKSEVAKLANQVKKLEGDKNAVAAELAKQNQAAQQAKTAVQNSQNEVNRWQGNLDFITQLGALNTQLAKQRDSVAQKQSQVDVAHQKLSEAQQVVDAAIQQRDQARNGENALQQQILELRKRK